MRYRVLLVQHCTAGEDADGLLPLADVITEVAACLDAYDVECRTVGCEAGDSRGVLGQCGKPDAVFVGAASCREANGLVRAVRRQLGDTPIVLLGACTTDAGEEAPAQSGADMVYTGPVGKGLIFGLKTFGIKPRLKKRQ